MRRQLIAFVGAAMPFGIAVTLAGFMSVGARKSGCKISGKKNLRRAQSSPEVSERY
jgi:hypothetical protein